MVEDLIREINILLEKEMEKQLASNKGKTYSEILKKLQQSKFRLKPYEVILVDELQRKLRSKAFNNQIKD